MKYILALQWDATKESDYDDLIAAEDKLINGLKGGAQVDGHDMGSGEMNIFIATDNPIQAFEDSKNALGSLQLWPGVRAAYRETTSDHYSIIWPQHLASFTVS